MCNVSCAVFGARALSKDDIEGKKYLEVGARDYNGTIRPLIDSWEPALSLGIDLIEGPGVDKVLDADDMVREFGEGSFDVVVAMEIMEHTRDWRRTMSNIKRVCRPGGIIVLTTRSFGYGYHAYPYDFWRFEIEDIKAIFSDCEIQILEKDPTCPGIYLKARKPAGFVERDLTEHALYSMITGGRLKTIEDEHFRRWRYLHLAAKHRIRQAVIDGFHGIGGWLFSRL